MPLNFQLVDANPNDTTGGGGSLASPQKDADATGPYFVWPYQEFESGASPFAVVAASEVRAMARALAEYEAGDLQALAGGEGVEVTVVPDGPGLPPRAPSEEYDFSDPEQFAAAFRREG